VSRNQLLLAAAAAALIMIAPLILLVVTMCRPANRARLAVASWIPVLILFLVSLGAWLWVLLAKVEIKVQISGTRELLLAVIAAIGIYMVWVVIPVAAVTWTLLKLRHVAGRSQ
jgi:hypothetical protein